MPWMETCAVELREVLAVAMRAGGAGGAGGVRAGGGGRPPAGARRGRGPAGGG